MTRRYVMCFTVHYQKKLGRKKTQTGSPKQPISPEGRLWRGSPGLIVEFSAYLAAMFPCFLMSSHVIPKWPRGENMVTEIFGIIPIIPYYPVLPYHPILWPPKMARLCQGAMQISSSTLAQCSKFFRLLGPFLACIREGSLSMVGICAIFNGFPGNLCL